MGASVICRNCGRLPAKQGCEICGHCARVLAASLTSALPAMVAKDLGASAIAGVHVSGEGESSIEEARRTR